ncbi:acetate/propionate family kinase [Roseobacter sp. HKCCD9010]|uniref:acetate/propionate family kinase n=1 Tax=unclassified Roseobacter TaxID=196798 RepID=UPI001492658E|nr:MULTISPECIES: acetate/propionate family kinase [unclassified Roseobacter]MBF9050803.1 acetate/propionate family kinase [Rhodobacterales bacterium HKCCD4356]NNV11779.1 acetate/propionate family kinase [Roseobacter sp. HKCCD7357]NNV17930.1 acetate/propionate family kinase [Roseobacter sp. HKCCD8768]NNV26021.1 acetate/propionate family kinase [Roseobacter sp. HKCCD8192]NNV31657.1 acetate/propionate family kinase [Roseobacter sp. HKCCD9061]
MSVILTLNAGSSTIKFGLYANAPEPVEEANGEVDALGPNAKLILTPRGADPVETNLGPTDHASGMQAILDAVTPLMAGRGIDGVGHRVVHGGPDFDGPRVLDPATIEQLRQFEPLAPLHQPYNLAGVEAAHAAFPQAAQVACFDTAFHRGHPWVNDTFALPRRFYDQGVRRYGFHGLSYDYIMGALRRDWPRLAEGRVIVAHLGNGASICAIKGGRSVGSSMGFSALDGLPMGTRSGQVDPGVLLYLMDAEGMGTDEISNLLYKESGLKGLSGITHDMRSLLQSPEPEAAEAIDYYVFRLRREIGAMAAVLGGVDALVFTGGIGENAAPIRARAVAGLDFLGLSIAPAANDVSAPRIDAGPVPVLVVPTDEERVIARAVVATLGDAEATREARGAWAAAE